MSRPRTRLAPAALGVSVWLVATGCAATRPARATIEQRRPPRIPVVLLPGMTGTQLVDRTTGEIAWGNALRIFFPRDHGHALALPVDPTRDDRDDLVPGDVVLKIRVLGLFGEQVYGPVLRLMRESGYTPGDLRDPRPGEDFFFFRNDWRVETADSAAELARQLARLREVRGEEVLRVNLVCQSNAGLIGRYFVKYGGASLEDAEAGRASPVAGVRVERLILVGSPNGGSLRMLREMNRGRRYAGRVGRSFGPETLFTFPSMYEGLPVHREDLFFDAEGKPISIDLFDAASWARHGWSVHGPEVARRLAKMGPAGPFGDEEARRRFLARRLERAATLHRLLRRDPDGFTPPRYYAIQDGYEPTPERALVVEREGGFATRFHDDPEVSRDAYLFSLAASPGDGHVTPESFRWMSPRELEALVHPPAIIRGGHFAVILDPGAKRRLIEFLHDPAPALEPSR